MALFNIFNEPRREITESVVGIICVSGIIGPIVFLGYCIAPALEGPGVPFILAWASSLIIVCFALIMMYIILQIIHVAGEYLCDRLEKNGMQIRPIQRYRAKRR
jgi:hypothetical protein